MESEEESQADLAVTFIIEQEMTKQSCKSTCFP